MRSQTIDYRLQTMNSRMNIRLLMVVCMLCLAAIANSQSVSAELRADSTHIQIGDLLKIRLSVKYSDNLLVAFPKAADTLGNMETIEVSKLDTTTAAGSIVLSQVYTVSAYDSGDFHAGPVIVYFKNSTGIVDSVLTNDIQITAGAPAVDLDKPFKDIKAPLEVPYSWREFVPYIIGLAVLLVAIIAGIILYRKYRNNKPVVVERPKPKDPPHIWARKELKKLEEEKLWQKDEVKQYYSRLTDVLRMYLEYRYDWFALESTTEEIEAELPKYKLKDKACESLLAILRAADLVKFAKMIPMPDANIKAMENAYKFIDFTEPSETKPEEKK
ncbi:MAG: hypothetical protein RLZZ367_2359 [Bacteroidota bacterium]